MKYSITTLGCKVNQYETQAMETMLRQLGYSPVREDDGGADVVIVNTCAVTAESGRKSRQAVRRLKNQNPGAVVVVCGCFSQVSPQEAYRLGADIVYGSGDRKKLVEEIDRLVRERKGGLGAGNAQVCVVDNPFKRVSFEKLPAGSVYGRTRAMLKIQDGCDNFCTYCVIPYARGRVLSLPVEEAAAQAAALEAEGYRELVITGIEIASYGKDFRNGAGLADVVEAIARSTPGLRLRLGSLEPTVITRDFCRRLAETGKICRHFHLSLQSGCDEILRRMGRKYDTARFFEAVQLLREYFPRCGLTADLIVGFPGETEEQHAATLEFIRKCGFSSMHIFPYSPRPGTKAAKMEGQLTRAVKARRAAEAQAVADAMEDAFLESCIGDVLPVLFETESEDTCIGHADNYCQVSVPGGGLRGVVKNVKIEGVKDKILVGYTV